MTRKMQTEKLKYSAEFSAYKTLYKDYTYLKLQIRMLYPDFDMPCIKHPDIGHISMTQKVFPYIVQKPMTFNEYVAYHRITYDLLCKDFDSYLAYLEEEHWNNFKNKHRNKCM